MSVPAAGSLAADIEGGDRACPQCDGLPARFLPRYSTGAWRIVACLRCGFVFLQNPPDYGRLVEEFAWEKTSAAESAHRRTSRPVLTFVDRRTRWRLHLFSESAFDFYRRIFSPGRVLDVGCGGTTSVPEPFIPYGIEISRALCERVAPVMAARGGQAFHAPAAEGIAGFPDGYFTGIVMRSVAEHERNPKKLFHHAARVLAQNGAIYVRVPNFACLNRVAMGAKWSGFRHPDHVNYFTLASLKRMVADCGLRLKLLRPLLLPFNDNVNAVLTKA